MSRIDETALAVARDELIPENARLDGAQVIELDRREDIWTTLRREAEAAAVAEPILASLLHSALIYHNSFGESLAQVLAERLGGEGLSSLMVRDVCMSAIADQPEIARQAERDLRAIRERDPACRTYLHPFLHFKGYAALGTHRISHWLWQHGREQLAFEFQSRMSRMFQVDIHPAATIGSGVFIDHGTGVVIGETAIVGDDCSLLQSVTLGGTGKERGDRHPKIGRGVLIGAGAKVLGNIHVGDEARIGSGSVVLSDVPARCTVVGVPARPVGGQCCPEPAKRMDQIIYPGDASPESPALWI
jgi:serine O-acetyltransferase